LSYTGPSTNNYTGHFPPCQPGRTISLHGTFGC